MQKCIVCTSEVHIVPIRGAHYALLRCILCLSFLYCHQYTRGGRSPPTARRRWPRSESAAGGFPLELAVRTGRGLPQGLTVRGEEGAPAERRTGRGAEDGRGAAEPRAPHLSAYWRQYTPISSKKALKAAPKYALVKVYTVVSMSH